MTTEIKTSEDHTYGLETITEKVEDSTDIHSGLASRIDGSKGTVVNIAN